MPIDRRPGNRAGQSWEDWAADYVAERGIHVITRGYRCRLGELDIVGSDEHCLVVIEVRARSSTRKASASESVDRNKQRRIVLATRHFLMLHPDWYSRPVRFDVIAIDGIETSRPTVSWLRNAFEPS